jgi:predicted secreted Zn-dependent protease
MFFAPPPAVVVPDTVITERTSHYDIKAIDEPGLVKEMNEKGPAGGGSSFWAITNGGVYSSWETKPVGSRCVLVNPRVSVGINIVYPSWVPPAGVKPQVVAKWNAMLKAMVRHEGEHAQFARDQGNALTAELRAHSSDSTCEQLESYLKMKDAEIGKKREAADLDLDDRTSHGSKEGVAISW